MKAEYLKQNKVTMFECPFGSSFVTIRSANVWNRTITRPGYEIEWDRMKSYPMTRRIMALIERTHLQQYSVNIHWHSLVDTIHLNMPSKCFYNHCNLKIHKIWLRRRSLHRKGALWGLAWSLFNTKSNARTTQLSRTHTHRSLTRQHARYACSTRALIRIGWHVSRVTSIRRTATQKPLKR